MSYYEDHGTINQLKNVLREAEEKIANAIIEDEAIGELSFKHIRPILNLIEKEFSDMQDVVYEVERNYIRN